LIRNQTKNINNSDSSDEDEIDYKRRRDSSDSSDDGDLNYKNQVISIIFQAISVIQVMMIIPMMK
jgi:hypothetical protein